MKTVLFSLRGGATLEITYHPRWYTLRQATRHVLTFMRNKGYPLR